ncbi:Angio-associated migratory cell, partial [Olea europaea subsp. europaea]
ELYPVACSPTNASLVARGGEDRGFLWKINQGEWAFELQGMELTSVDMGLPTLKTILPNAFVFQNSKGNPATEGPTRKEVNPQGEEVAQGRLQTQIKKPSPQKEERMKSVREPKPRIEVANYYKESGSQRNTAKSTPKLQNQSPTPEMHQQTKGLKRWRDLRFSNLTVAGD